MFKIIEGLDSKGWIDKDDIPEYFLERCGRTAEFIDAVNNAYEIFKLEMIWKSRMSESRGAISKHYKQLSEVIGLLTKEINTEVGFLGHLERDISQQLKRKGIAVEEITAIENNLGRFEINVLHTGCRGAGNCVSIINKAVSDVSGRRMSSANNDCCGQTSGSCMLRLLEEDNYRITTGVARVPKYGNRESGDSFTFLNTADGKYVVALSDGMGSGYNAAVQSKTTIGLLEAFLESGFNKDMAVNMINSILMLKTGDETFSTIDVTSIDLYNGNVEFIKTGAAPSFIKNGESVEIIRAASLPAGILKNVETELMRHKIDDNNMVILVSDGVLESFEGEISGEKALMCFIKDLVSINPQEIADKILEKCMENCKEEPKDDMTVLVAKLWRQY
jgi:stage II sporulation protein E